MNTKKFSDAMSEIDGRYVDEALNYKKKVKKPVWIKWGAMAACLCLMLVAGVTSLQRGSSTIPDPEKVQVPNPIIEAATLEEMERYLDFDVPVLDKEIKLYSVYIEDDDPAMGQITYADGSEFRIRYGSGDISGIFGSTLEGSKEINGIKVEYYKYKEITYAIWEQSGFTFSYVYTNDGDTDVEALIRQYK